MQPAPYDHNTRRWLWRPYPMCWSEMVLGRMAAHRTLAEVGEITVSAFRVMDGRIFYTDPVNPNNRAGPGVLYRINVRLRGDSCSTS